MSRRFIVRRYSDDTSYIHVLYRHRHVDRQTDRRTDRRDKRPVDGGAMTAQTLEAYLTVYDKRCKTISVTLSCMTYKLIMIMFLTTVLMIVIITDTTEHDLLAPRPALASPPPLVLAPRPAWSFTVRDSYKKLSCCREAARCFVSLNISLSHSSHLRSFEMTPLSIGRV